MFSYQNRWGLIRPILRPLWLMTLAAADVIGVPSVYLVSMPLDKPTGLFWTTWNQGGIILCTNTTFAVVIWHTGGNSGVWDRCDKFKECLKSNVLLWDHLYLFLVFSGFTGSIKFVCCKELSPNFFTRPMMWIMCLSIVYHWYVLKHQHAQCWLSAGLVSVP